MTRKTKILHFVTLLALCVFVVSALHTHAQAAEAARPNVILFLVDDMGRMDCEPYGSKYYDTPNFVKDTGALYPQPNPAYKPRPAAKP